MKNLEELQLEEMVEGMPISSLFYYEPLDPSWEPFIKGRG